MHPARFLGRLLASAALVSTWACGEAFSPLELGTAQQAVVGGEPSPDDDYVVRVYGRPPPGTQAPRTCTGTLIAPNLVLTALHCLSPLTGDGNFTCNINGESDNPPNGNLGIPLEPQYIAVHGGAEFTLEPDAIGAELFHTRSTNICQNDIAFVVLDRELDYPIAPVRLNSRVTVGEVVTAIGYGLTTNPPPPVGEITQRRRRSGVRIAAVESEGREKTRARTFTLPESVCMGDSGGSPFSAQGAALGVYSTNAAGCEGTSARNAFTMLSAFRLLALEAFAAAGAEPWLEGQPPPGTVIDAGAVPQPDAQAHSEPDSDTGEPDPPDPPPDEESPPVTTPGSGRVDSGFCAVQPRATHDGRMLALAGITLASLATLRRRRRV